MDHGHHRLRHVTKITTDQNRCYFYHRLAVFQLRPGTIEDPGQEHGAHLP